MEDPLHIAICEDAVTDQELLLETISKCNIPSECTVFPNGESLLNAYRPHVYDLILSDIFMDGIGGVETITKIRELDESIPIAFITTSTDFTLEGYRLSALKYIEKPFKQKDLDDILKLAQLERFSAPSLVIQRNRIECRIRFSQIMYLEQQKHLLHVHLQDGTVEVFRKKLSSILPQFEDTAFFQPHKSFLVNPSYVRSIDSDLRCLVMYRHENVPIRRESLGKTKQIIKNYLFSKTRAMEHV